jgi:GDP-L-fucose synthase
VSNPKNEINLKGRRIFVAGGSGLLGFNMVLKLQELGADYRASYLVHPPASCLDHFERFDLTKSDDCLRATSGVTDMIMCAGVTSGAKRMKENPSAAILPNLEIGANLLEAAHLNKVERVVFVSSATVYQEMEKEIREDDLDLNVSPYSLYLGVGNVNRCLEQLCHFYSQKYGIKIGIVRPSNLYGPYDHFEEDRSHVLPALIRRAIAGEDPFRVWGSGLDVRDFIYVEDAVEGILRVLQNYCVCDPLNLGSGCGVNIRDAAQMVVSLCRHSVPLNFDANAPTAIPFRVLDMTKFTKMIGPLKQTSLKDGLQKTITWYRQSLKAQTVIPVKARPAFTISGVHSGLGKYLHQQFGGEGFGRQNSKEILARLASEGADVILHCAFNSSRDVSDRNLQQYYEDNVLLTEKLAAIPHRKFIYFSTIDVYPLDGRIHREDDEIFVNQARGIYGTMKLTAESIVRKSCPNYLILRCSAFLGEFARMINFRTLLEQDNPALTLTPQSSFNYLLHSDMSDFIRYCVEQDLHGIYNCVSKGNILISEVAELLKKDVRYGDYFYNTGLVSNDKIAAVYPAFRKTSREVALEFIGSRKKACC